MWLLLLFSVETGELWKQRNIIQLKTASVVDHAMVEHGSTAAQQQQAEHRTASRHQLTSNQQYFNISIEKNIK